MCPERYVTYVSGRTIASVWQRPRVTINERRMSLEPLEVDEAFDSLESWERWVSDHRSLFEAGYTDRIGQKICREGFIEPLSGRSVEGDRLDAANRNWREGLAANGLNSRLRAVLRVIDGALSGQHASAISIYAAEAISPFAMLLRGRFPRFLGSEYIPSAAARRSLFPIPHEDLTRLSFPSDSFDVVITNEVLEHVPDLDSALSEMARVLRPGGWHIGTHPFHSRRAHGELRTRLVDGEVINVLPPEYHQDPLDTAGGALVFEIPGWDILARAREAGFQHARMRLIASERFGCFSSEVGIFVLCAQKKDG